MAYENNSSSDKGYEALPKSVQNNVNNPTRSVVPDRSRNSGCGRIAAIGCVTCVIIFLIVMVLILIFGFQVVKNITSESSEPVSIGAETILNGIINEVKEEIFDVADDFETSVKDGKIMIGKEWEKDHFHFDNAVSEDGMYHVDSDGISNIDLEWVAGDILIITEDRDDIEFCEEYDGKHPLHYGVKNDTLYIYFVDTFEKSRINVKEKSLTVRIPEVLGESLKEFDISTVSSNCRTSGNIGRKLDLETVSGELLIDSPCQEFKAESVSGYIEYTADVCPYKFEAESVSGDIFVRLTSDSDFSLEFETVSGKLDSDLNLVKVEKDHYIHGNGIAEFEVETTSGNLKISEQKGIIE